MGLLSIAKRALKGRPPVGTSAADVVHAENKWRLLRYRSPEVRYRTPVLLVPSLINRHYVLDLLPGRSFAQHLVEHGFDVFCIDWGTPTDEDRYLTFEDVADRYLGRALRVASRASDRGAAHVLGYCMGGTLAAAHVARRPERVATLMTLAAPIAFSDEGLLSRWVQTDGFDVDALVSGVGNVPWPLMQASFHMLRPTLSLLKLVSLVDRADDDRFLDTFFATETWANDNVSFPGDCYRRYIRELYREDRLVRGELSLGGRAVRLSDIRCPLLAVSFTHDPIVPEASAAPLVELAGSADKEHLRLPGGHVGAVVSRAGMKTLWPRLAGWWAERDAPAPVSDARGGAAGSDGPHRASEAPQIGL